MGGNEHNGQRGCSYKWSAGLVYYCTSNLCPYLKETVWGIGNVSFEIISCFWISHQLPSLPHKNTQALIQKDIGCHVIWSHFILSMKCPHFIKLYFTSFLPNGPWILAETRADVLVSCLIRPPACHAYITEVAESRLSKLCVITSRLICLSCTTTHITKSAILNFWCSI